MLAHFPCMYVMAKELKESKGVVKNIEKERKTDQQECMNFLSWSEMCQIAVNGHPVQANDTRDGSDTS